MPLPTQAKILRVLETRQVTPLGSVRPKAIDVRFIAATNRNLDAFVGEGKFREDLLFRISGVTIAIPPLRDRPSEIAKLADKLLAEECERAGKPKKQLAAPMPSPSSRAIAGPEMSASHGVQWSVRSS